jgi:hypothetical protein
LYLPDDLRATFTRIMLHAHVEAHRENPLVDVRYAHLWDEIETKVTVDRFVLGMASSLEVELFRLFLSKFTRFKPDRRIFLLQFQNTCTTSRTRVFE